jgi:hypothetical protein
MNRYRSYGAQDDQPQVAGDQAFLGVNEYDTPQNLQPGEVQKAVNLDFKNQAAETRGGFVCYPEIGTIPFGHVWTYNGIGAAPGLKDVSYGAGVFVAVGNGGAIYSSPDAITWTARTAPNTANYTDVAYANGRFIAVGGTTGSAAYPVAYSDDGIIWSLPSSPFSITRTGISYGNGIWVAVGTNAVSISDDNGDTWTTTTGLTALGPASGVSFGNGLFCAVALGGGIITSTDGLTWTSIYIANSGVLLDVAFGNQRFVTVDVNGRVFISTDAVTWTQTRSSDGDTWRTITYGNGIFVAFADTSGGDNVMYSISGTNWIKLSDVPNYSWQGSTYGNGAFVAVGNGGATMYSNSMAPAVFGSGVYSDPNNIGETWIMVVSHNKVGFFASGRTSKTISLGSYTVTEQSTIVQANNYVYIFRGDSQTPLYWDGNWNGTFAEVPATTLPDSFESIPDSNQATYYQNRLWVRKGKDGIAASDVLSFTDYDPLANEFNLNTGNSDYVVATYPFGQNSLVAFKNKSILLLQNVEGSLSDVTVTEVTRQVGVVGINSVTSIGPDLAYVSNRNINLLTLTSTNNSLQHKTLPLSTKIRKIIDRVNWDVGYKISLGYWNNRLYVALPLDNSTVCNAVVVYNFITDRWYGEWNFSDSLNMCIQGWQVVDYLGLQRMHAITEDGRIFVTDEGQNDISGTTVAEISTELVTRAYMTQNLNHFQRRMFMDVATNRPDFSVWVYTDGANEESSLLTDQAYTRSESWLFNDSSYDLTNANNDYNRAYRKDYSTGPNSVQSGTGFQPEMLQEQRLPLIARRQGRLSWIKLTNTQGLLTARTLGYETRPGQRANLTQV